MSKFSEPWSAGFSHDALADQQSAQVLNPAAIDSQVTVSNSRRRSYGNHSLSRSQMKFEVIDKAEDRTGAFGVKIIRSFSNDGGAGKIFHGAAYGRPCVPGGHRQRKCGNDVRRIIGVA
jgi:hypothetical protein